MPSVLSALPGLSALSAAALAAGLLTHPAAPSGDGGDGGSVLSLRTDARFAPPGSLVPSPALTYDTALVPAGAWIEVGRRGGQPGPTTVWLRVKGLVPGRAYDAHVHREPCGADPAAADGHYQHEPSADPQAANAENEVWLDFTADDRGAGRAGSTHPWGFRRGEASSVVLHDGEENSGKARLACFTVPFGRTTTA